MEYPEEDTLNIYTDGSSLPKPRRGGIGILFVFINAAGDEEDYLLPRPGYSGASNNLMELEACVQALRVATGQQRPFQWDTYSKILIKTDSEYVASNFDTALFTWSQNGWLKKSEAPVDNAPQWKELVKLARRATAQGTPVRVEWVPGKKSPRTKAVDKAAKKAAKYAPARQLVPSEVRRKKTERPIEIGSVSMEGQMMTINVFKTEFQSLHRLVKCWYTVESRRSPYRGCADVIYADPALPLRRGHGFQVRVNEDTGNPRIVRVFKELD